MTRIELPIRAESVANLGECWQARSRRAKKHREAATLLCFANRAAMPPMPAKVTLTRIAPRPLDDDNLRGALKAVRDGVADFYGVNDRDPRIVWEYAQERGKPKEYAVKLDISTAS